MKIPIVDDRLNKITMYRITLYFLMILVGVAVGFSFLGILSYSPIDILIDCLALLIVCYISNLAFATFFKAYTNFESVFITSLILLLILPVQFPANIIFIIAAGFGAMAIKYLPTINKTHIFNPAAGSIAAISLLSSEHTASWWIGTPAMFPFVFLGGLIIIRKVRRESMVLTFLLMDIILVSIFSFIHFGNISSISDTVRVSFLSTPLVFFAFIMFVEPITSPVTKKMQYLYAVLVAVLYATPQMRLLGFALTPEQALSVGNIFSYIVSPKYRLLLKLKEKVNVATNTVVFNFGKVDKFAFIPGQYLEWTLPHKNMDSRGNRRYFSIASSPQEDLQIAVRFHDKSSSYKREMLSMKAGDEIVAASLSGDFVMPKDISSPVVFMAGGIGVAPFRSIIENVVDKNIRANIILMYSNRLVTEIAFADLFEKAKANGVRAIYTLTDSANLPPNWSGEVGHFTPEMIKKYVPDSAGRIFYVSGPQPMVQSTEALLRVLPTKKIVTDYFPGYEETS